MRAARWLLVAASVFALTTVVPGTAAAEPALGVSDRCPVFWPGTAADGAKPITVTAVGMLPLQAVTVTLTVRDRTVGQIPLAQADVTGALVGRITGWDPQLGSGPGPSVPALLTLRDRFTAELLDTIPLRLGTVGVRVDTSPRSAGTKRQWEVSGLSRYGGSRTYFAHYFKRGRWIGRQRLGLGVGPCGYLRTYKPLLPFARTGTFAVRIQSSRRYRSDLPYLGGTLRHRRSQRR